MKKSINLFGVIVCLLISAQIQSQDIDLDDLVIDSNEAEFFFGKLVLHNKQLHFASEDCFLNGIRIQLKDSDIKKFNSKSWIKKVKKSNGTLNNILVKGLLSEDKKSIQVVHINKPLKTPKKWSNGSSGLYLDTAVSLYQETIKLRETYKVFSISVEEVEDSELGTVTEYSIYDKNCKKLSTEEIKEISSEDLGALDNSINIGSDLLIKQATLAALADASQEELEGLGTLEKIKPGKDAVTAALYQAAILVQLPRMIDNLKASKQYIKQLQSE